MTSDDDRCVILFVPLLIIENRRHPFCYATTATGNRQQAKELALRQQATTPIKSHSEKQ